MSPKINDMGKYLPFSGYTIIAKLPSKDNSTTSKIWDQLYKELSSLEIGEYYSFLPRHSLHVTTTDLFTQHKLRLNDDKWKEYINNQITFFKKIDKLLKYNVFRPEISISKVIVKNVILIEVNLDNTQKKIINEVAKKIDYEHKVPIFHVTLAYRYKEIPAEKTARIQKKLETIVENILGQTKSTLLPPTLCSFEDMTTFDAFVQ